jgi:hypothetical protein
MFSNFWSSKLRVGIQPKMLDPAPISKYPDPNTALFHVYAVNRVHSVQKLQAGSIDPF